MNALTAAAMQTVAASATESRLLQQNRARAASVVELGYEGVDAFEEWSPTIFLIACLGAAASGWGLYKRKKVPEAVALYTMTGIVSSVAAWITRPAYMRSAPAPASTPEATSAPGTPATAALLGWMDKRVARLSQEQPGWEARAWGRLAQDVGYGTMDPAVQVLLTRNSR